MISKKPWSENSIVKMKDRCTLGNAVFQSFKKVWLKIDTKIPVDKKLLFCTMPLAGLLRQLYYSINWTFVIVIENTL